MTENSAQADIFAQEDETGAASGLTRELLYIGRLGLSSRLIMGTGGATSIDTLEYALVASGTELTTVAIRRFVPGTKQNVFEILQHNNIAALPNTAGCYTARDAVLTAQLARKALETSLLELEVIAGEDMLLPDPVELVAAVEQSVADDSVVFAYTNDDPALVKRLENLSCAAVMSAGPPIGIDLGILNPHNTELIADHANVPITLDASIGTTSGAVQAIELGCDVALLASAVTRIYDPAGVTMTVCFNVEIGLTAHELGRIPRRRLTQVSSSPEGTITKHTSGAREQNSL